VIFRRPWGSVVGLRAALGVGVSGRGVRLAAALMVSMFLRRERKGKWKSECKESNWENAC
jgi:hypothetical protein